MAVSPISQFGGITVGYLNGNIKPPTTCKSSIVDISSADAGNSDNGTMFKFKQGEKINWAITWKAISIMDAALILSVCKNEYFDITFLDPETGSYDTHTYYVGDRTLGEFNGVTGKWNELSFNMIQRNVI